MRPLALAAAVLAACQPASAPMTTEGQTSDASIGPEITIPAGSASAATRPAPRVEPPPAPTATSVSLPARVTGDVAWIVAARRERGFKSLVLEGAGPLHVTWVRMAAQTDPGSGMPAARVMLVVSRDAGLVQIDAGIVPGEIEPSGATLCGRLGYRESNGALLEPAPVNGLVSELTVGNMSGADDLLVVLGAGVLHVLRGQVTDGMCASQIKQGPLTVCRGQEVARVAEVRLGPVSSFEESILVAADGDDAGARSPLDCAVPTIMGTLTPPAAR